jgi:hypothetical protein
MHRLEAVNLKKQGAALANSADDCVTELLAAHQIRPFATLLG